MPLHLIDLRLTATARPEPDSTPVDFRQHLSRRTQDAPGDDPVQEVGRDEGPASDI